MELQPWQYLLGNLTLKIAIAFKKHGRGQKGALSSCALGHIYVHRYPIPADNEAFITHCEV